MSKAHSLGEIIHKESSKEKQNAKGLLAIGQKENTARHTQLQVANSQKDKTLSKHRLAKLRINAEIDEFLHSLLLDGMIDEQYWPWHAKACHILGIPLCNRLAINARNGANSQRLYASKIKGALQLKAKRQYESID